MSKPLALFCFLHPGSIEKKDRVLSLLAAAKPYYLSPISKCTTWTYFTPSRTLGTAIPPSALVSPSEADTLIASLEMYTDKSALGVQTESDMFKEFHATAEREGLYDRAEELTVWYPAAGFVARESGDGEGRIGKGVLVLTAMLVAKKGRRDELVEVLRKYAEWVKQNEPGFLTYVVMVRPKAPDEILLVERCTGQVAFTSHVGTATFKDAMKQASQYIKSGQGQEWSELDNGFVGKTLGGDSKL